MLTEIWDTRPNLHLLKNAQASRGMASNTLQWKIQKYYTNWFTFFQTGLMEKVIAWLFTFVKINLPRFYLGYKIQLGHICSFQKQSFYLQDKGKGWGLNWHTHTPPPFSTRREIIKKKNITMLISCVEKIHMLALGLALLRGFSK